jgi:hypothetical protein
MAVLPSLRALPLNAITFMAVSPSVYPGITTARMLSEMTENFQKIGISGPLAHFFDRETFND